MKRVPANSCLCRHTSVPSVPLRDILLGKGGAHSQEVNRHLDKTGPGPLDERGRGIVASAGMIPSVLLSGKRFRDDEDLAFHFVRGPWVVSWESVSGDLPK